MGWACPTPFTPGTAVEFGRSNYDTTNNWVGASHFDMSQVSTSFNQMIGTLGDTALGTSTWTGALSTVWTNPGNWSSGVPSDLADVVIPDAATTANDPQLDGILAVGRVTLESGGILNAAATSAVTVSGASGAWSDNGGTFNASTSTVIFTNAAATISGETEFYNVTINSGAGLSMGSGSIMRIAGTMTNNGTWPAEGLDNVTIEYNGADQTVLSPNGVTPGYDNLILSGSGTKTLPGTALSLGGDFTLSGTATAAPASALTIGGNVTLGSGTTFTGGAYTHNIAGDWTNNGATVTLTGTTINLNGTAAQAIGGTATTAFNNLTISNTSAAVSANTNFSAGGNLTVNASAILNPAAAVVISGGGTLTGNGTVNVTRTAATADFSSQYTITTKTLTNLTVAYSGSAAQTVSALTYGGLKINNANGVTLAGNATVNGTLTLTGGKITTAANTVIIGSSGSVSGGSSSYVIGNLQKYVATGSDVSRTFEVGATNYNPVTVLFASVSVAGNLTAKMTSGEHPEIATSALSSSQDVNAYWTLTKDGTLAFTSYGATFTFVAGDIDSGADTSTFNIGRYSSGWTYPAIGTRTSTTTQATGLTSLSDFVAGELFIWESYQESERTTVRDIFNSTYSTAYMKGTGFTPSATYNIAYYDGNGYNLWNDDGVSADGSGNLLSSIILSNYSIPPITAGTFHALVQPTGSTPFPEDYATAVASPETYDLMANDSFDADAEAIPEFPTVMAGIVVAGACFGIYWWMRKRSYRVCRAH